MMVVFEIVLVIRVVLVGLVGKIMVKVVVLVLKVVMVLNIVVVSKHGIGEKIRTTAFWALKISSTERKLKHFGIRNKPA